MAAARDPETQKSRLGQVNYYLGMKHLIDGDKVGAMDFFQQCIVSSKMDSVEYDNAQSELGALKKDFPP